MFFRDGKKELLESLYYTHKLEKELQRDGARGTSLSDKIKSYQTLQEEDFDEGYEFRAYKRSLLDGRYNALRWVAHERNQMMHQKGYLIPMYAKFKLTIKDGIKYLKNNKLSGGWEGAVLLLLKALPYIAAIVVVGYILMGLSLFKNLTWSDITFWKIAGVVFVVVIAFGLAVRAGEVLAGLSEIGIELFDFFVRFVTKNRVFVLVMIAGFLFWHYEFTMLETLQEHLWQIAKEFTKVIRSFG